MNEYVEHVATDKMSARGLPVPLEQRDLSAKLLEIEAAFDAEGDELAREQIALACSCYGRSREKLGQALVEYRKIFRAEGGGWTAAVEAIAGWLEVSSRTVFRWVAAAAGEAPVRSALGSKKVQIRKTSGHTKDRVYRLYELISSEYADVHTESRKPELLLLADLLRDLAEHEQKPVMPKSEMVAKPEKKLKIIYEPAGAAREYAPLACNLYVGCNHDCDYCYCRRRKSPAQVQALKTPHVVKSGDVLRKLEDDCKVLPPGSRIFTSFTSDPWNSLDEELGLTRKAIEVIHNHGHYVTTLTKAGSKSLRDLDLFRAGDLYGATLTQLDDERSRQWEPGAALPQDRVDTLRKFHEAGIETFVSMEPVLNPAVALEIIKMTHPFVGEFRVGKLNKDRRANGIDWARFTMEAVALLESLGARYLIKDSLRPYLPAPASATIQ